MKKILFILIVLLTDATSFAQDYSTKQERNLIKDGNGLYHKKRYADAEVNYRKALSLNPTSEIANFNLASSLIKQAGASDPNSQNSPLQEATKIMTSLSQSASNLKVKESSFYNLGNLAFNTQDYQKSIDFYKSALRINPNNDLTRQNLRLAQLKLKEQQNQDNKNQDKRDKQNNQDKRDKQNNQDKQDQQDQDNKDRQDKNNQDKQNQQNQDNKDQQNPNSQEKKNDDKQRQQQQQNGISDQNAEQILNALENQENVIRKRVNGQLQKNEAATRNRTRHKW